MVTLSKKDARKLKVSKGKGKEEAIKSTKIPKQAEREQEDDDEDSSENEDDYGISEEGMKRLMELVDPEDLDEFEKALLGGDEDGEDAEEEEDDEDEDDEDEELLSGEEALSDEDSEDDDEDEDEDGEELDNTIVNEKPDDDAISLDGLNSDVSVDEDAVPMRKVTINNKPAMRTIIDTIKVTNMPWPEHLVLNSKEIVDVDPSDDLQREMAFYKIALECIPQAKKLATKHDIPFTRPNDYYAEMVKSDEHMERVRTKLVEESQGIKKSEAAKKQRDLKKFGKQIQHEKLKQREQDKKSFEDRVSGLKRKRKEGMELGEDGDDDQFGISVEDAIEGRPERGGSGRGGRGGRDKAKMPRHVRDNKYSLGGSSRRDKQNTRESTNDFSFGGGKPGRGRGGGKFGGGGGRGGGSGGRGGGGGGGGRGGGRPGKSRRQAGRV
ncbi:uncharacterized protein I206_104670 [Kwoniella pini CBS 10737]|uniref:rRNA-processing protein EBP2 n=1 Tax=Kwoniella pini CBS 10737 TaxID=1296096 RepID=A0A1B9I7K0_9TREE|nr:rRNA-processing protein EBP2 [Kwoniella pini CBS 10737]OCF51494.1 rRNA-processing protein EBP2 [Kwoniella pini CBS 10737]